MRKECRTCGGEKPLHAFNFDRRHRDGRATECRACARLRGRAYRSANLPSVRQRERINAMRYRMAHPNRRRMIARESARRRRALSA